ncbi:MAG TPA: transcription antitermination factor NusB, partial [bacterium]|nr:transcription antitermination factor NusB [bacterium]
LNLLEDMHLDKEIYPFVEMHVLGVLRNKNRIDELISRYSINWDISRMSYIDRNILRIAVYEMLYLPDIPRVAAINEAIEIAKMYSSSESGKFINGILDRIRKELPCERNAGLPTNNK